MLKYILNWHYYRFFKSGLLLDFYFKRLSFKLLQQITVTWAIYFSEKFLIEETFLKIRNLKQFIKLVQNMFTRTLVIQFFFIFLLILVVLLNV